MKTERCWSGRRTACAAWSRATWRAPSLLLAAALAAAAPDARAGGEVLEMFNNAEPPFAHSTGLFAFLPPPGWSCQQNRDSSVECRGQNGPQPGVLTVTHQTVEGQLDAELMALNAEKQLKRLPHYQRTGGGRLLLGDVKAAIRSFRFDYQGNNEYPVAVEELYVVSGGKAIRVHFETMLLAMPHYMGDLKRFYDTLGVAEVDAMGQVVAGAQPRNVPGARKGKAR
jgi:hypothetical protein